ncbi:hypothetical protein [Ureibacillus thermosphaericus]|uniref:hypothetical protein n=1 Tax=Ureibacillus thermosphaericus TaxID=51173 RepID=UPI000BBC985B|nr:hypothetical protein [Ureibacillus thermosphaericus]
MPVVVAQVIGYSKKMDVYYPRLGVFVFSLKSRKNKTENSDIIYATVVNIANHIKNDISESSSALSRKEVYHLDQTLKVNNKLDEILKLLKETKSDRP